MQTTRDVVLRSPFDPQLVQRGNGSQRWEAILRKHVPVLRTDLLATAGARLPYYSGQVHLLCLRHGAYALFGRLREGAQCMNANVYLLSIWCNREVSNRGHDVKSSLDNS